MAPSAKVPDTRPNRECGVCLILLYRTVDGMTHGVMMFLCGSILIAIFRLVEPVA